MIIKIEKKSGEQSRIGKYLSQPVKCRKPPNFAKNSTKPHLEKNFFHMVQWYNFIDDQERFLYTFFQTPLAISGLASND